MFSLINNFLLNNNNLCSSNNNNNNNNYNHHKYKSRNNNYIFKAFKISNISKGCQINSFKFPKFNKKFYKMAQNKKGLRKINKFNIIRKHNIRFNKESNSNHI